MSGDIQGGGHPIPSLHTHSPLVCSYNPPMSSLPLTTPSILASVAATGSSSVHNTPSHHVTGPLLHSRAQVTSQQALSGQGAGSLLYSSSPHPPPPHHQLPQGSLPSHQIQAAGSLPYGRTQVPQHLIQSDQGAGSLLFSSSLHPSSHQIQQAPTTPRPIHTYSRSRSLIFKAFSTRSQRY